MKLPPGPEIPIVEGEEALSFWSMMACVLFFFFFVFVFFVFRAAPVANGGSQARGQIKATAASLHHSHSNATSKLCLQPTPQLMAWSEARD